MSSCLKFYLIFACVFICWQTFCEHTWDFSFKATCPNCSLYGVNPVWFPNSETFKLKLLIYFNVHKEFTWSFHWKWNFVVHSHLDYQNLSIHYLVPSTLWRPQFHSPVAWVRQGCEPSPSVLCSPSDLDMWPLHYHHLIDNL